MPAHLATPTHPPRGADAAVSASAPVPRRRRWLRRIAWALAVVVALLVLLVGAAYVFGPPYAKRIAEANFSQRFGRPVTIGRVEVFPFRLGVAIHDVRIGDASGAPPLLDVAEVSLRLGVAGSLTDFAPVIEDYLIRAPKVHVVRIATAPDRFNFSDVVDRLASGEAGKAPPPFKVLNIRVIDGRIDFEDRVTGGKHAITDWSFSLPVFSNLPKDIDRPLEPSLSARVDGAPLSISGRTRILQQARDTDLVVDFADFDLTRYVRYLPRALPLEAKGGKVSLRLALALARRADQSVAVQAKGEVTVADVALDEKGGSAVLRAPKTSIAIAEVAIPENRLELASVVIESPSVLVRREAGGDINWQVYARALGGSASGSAPPPGPTAAAVAGGAAVAVAPAPSPAGAAAAAAASAVAGASAAGAQAAPWSLKVGEVRITRGVVDFADRTLQPALTAKLHDIESTVRDLSTQPGATAEVTLALAGDSGEALTTKVRVVLDPLAVQGDAALSGVRLARYAPYLGDALAAAVRDGSVAAKGQFEFAPASGILRVSALEADLASLAIQDPRSKRPLVTLAQLSAKGADIDLATRSVQVGSVSADRGSVRVVRGKNGELDIVRLMTATGEVRVGKPAAAATRAARASPSGTAAAVAPAWAATAKPAPAGAPPAWKVSVARIRLERFSGTLEDRVPAEPVTHALDRLSLDLDDFSTAPKTRMRVAARATVNRKGSVEARGVLAIDPLAGELQVSARGIDLQPSQNYFDDVLKIAIRSGSLNARGGLSFSLPQRAPPRLAWKGDASVTDFGSVTKENGEDLLVWKSLSGLGMNVRVNGDAGPFAADIETLTLSDFFSRLIIFPDGSLNVQDILVREGQAGEPREGAPAKSSGVGEASTGAAAGPTARTSTGKRPLVGDIGIDRPVDAPPMRIGRVVLERGRVDFSDRFIQPNYSADLSDVEGTVVGLSSAFDARADVAITARYDKSAPVEIKGTINPLRGDLYLDLAAQARDIEMVPFTPYAQKYAGYGITKGKLSLTVKYNIEGRKLAAENRVFVDQLTFGEKVDSPDATKLPVLLAVALLKNSRGEIDINLPISGSLDDPQFSVGGLILRVIVNLLVKVATAPFALISSLLGGTAQELGWVEFAPGLAVAATASDERLASLAKALVDRPQLKLDIAGRVDRDSDRTGLQQHLVERKARARKQAEMVRRGEPAPAIDAITLAPEEYRRYLRELHVAEIGPLPAAAGAAATPTASASMDAAIEAALRERIAVGDDDFRRLADARADAAKSRLVSAGVERERIFIVADVAVDDQAKTRSARRADFALK